MTSDRNPLPRGRKPRLVAPDSTDPEKNDLARVVKKINRVVTTPVRGIAALDKGLKKLKL